MPKLSNISFATKPFKKFTNYRSLGYKFKICLPPILRDYVPSRSDKSNAAYCVPEMSVMLACWKRNNFKQHLCSEELAVFDKCVQEAQAAQKLAREAAQHNKTTATRGRYPAAQVNMMLSRYPQPPVDIRLKDKK